MTKGHTARQRHLVSLLINHGSGANVCRGVTTSLVGVMARIEFVRARPISLIAALLLIVLSLGVGGTASADPGNRNDNGNGAENSALAQQDNGSGGKSTASSGSSKAQSSKAGTDGTDGHPGTSGVVTEPQPNSNADLNVGGANGQCADYEGPYCSTRSGLPSLNGNGGGQAVGRPPAGSVGKADNKNPQGQMPDGSDHNNGYECDGNNGIAKTNPAHTGCTTLTTTTTPPPPSVDRPRPPADIAGVETVRPPAVVPVAVPPVAVPAAPPAGVLPATGTPDLLGLLGGGGMGLLMLGGLTIWLHRRIRATS